MKNANPVSSVLRGVLLFAVTLALTACSKSESAATQAAPKTVADYFPIKVGARVVQMQLAVTPVEQQRGLMERRDLQPEQGMLFLYLRPQQLSFWMRNTPTPLDIGFFTAEGELREIYPMYPFDETSVKSRRSDLQFALEMNQGWFKSNGVKPGDKLDLKALSAAVKARGFPLRAYGLKE